MIELKQLPKLRGTLLWEGPSLLNGEPIVAIATLKTSNRKTGDMIQTWILPQNMRPTDAVDSGDDKSICGDCPHRKVDGKRTCYVNVGQAPLQVWKSYRAGKYPRLPELSAITEGRRIRFGAYGDPAAVPSHVWLYLKRHASGWTGYTHQWRTCDHNLMDLCMASVDTQEEAEQAQAMGWRTFRCRSADEPLMHREIMCPASDEGGKRTTCDNCLLCAGRFANKKRKIPSVSIVVHGRGAVHFGNIAANNLRQGD